MPQFIRGASLGVCLMFVASVLFAENTVEPLKLKQPLTLAWIVEERLDAAGDADASGEPRTPTVFKDTLDALNIRTLPEAEAHTLRNVCPVSKLLAGEWCEAIDSQRVDVVVAGTLTGEPRETGPAGPEVGLTVTASLAIFRVDTREKLYEMTLKPYGTGEGKPQAFDDALKKVRRPLAIQISHPVARSLDKRLEGFLHIDGTDSDAKREDPLTSLRFLPGVYSLMIEEQKPAYTVYRVGFEQQTWGQFVQRIAATQGTGVTEARVTGQLKAEGRFRMARAFRLLLSVAEPDIDSRLAYTPERRDRILATLEAALRELDVVMTVPFPVRLPADPKKAMAEMRKQYGGDVVVFVELKSLGDDIEMRMSARATFARRPLASLNADVGDGDFEAAAESFAAELKRTLPELLKNNQQRFSAFKRAQYKAWAGE